MGSDRVRARTTLAILAVALASSLAPTATAAQESGVRADLQLSLFARILGFDRGLADRVGEELVIGVLYQEENHPSRDAMVELRNAVAASTITHVGDVRARIEILELDDLEAVGEQLVASEIDVLYVAPLRAVDIALLGSIAEGLGILTLTGVPDYVGRGLAVGVEARDGRAEILIDTVAASGQGAHFSAQLLKVASLVQRQQR